MEYPNNVIIKKGGIKKMTKYRITVVNSENVKIERTYEKIKETLKQVQILLEWGYKKVTIEKFNTNE